jgi:Tfp pilus assembly protein PilF
MLADCYYLQVYYRYNTARETISNAEGAAERVLLLDDSVAEAHVAMAMVQPVQKKGRLCMESLRRALELNPNLAIAHQRYAWCLCALVQCDASKKLTTLLKSPACSCVLITLPAPS